MVQIAKRRIWKIKVKHKIKKKQENIMDINKIQEKILSYEKKNGDQKNVWILKK